ncbi:MAG TPA: DUF222 domain-containing protein [Actinomycetes bacterium]|nr:DUF222 domain-containing protein [Actinomycetes bacterium]
MRLVVFRPSSLPAQLDDVVQIVRSLSTPEAHERLTQVGPDARAAWLSGLQQLTDAVAAASIVATDAFDAAGDAQTLAGAASTQSWLRGALRLTAGEATTRVQLARASRGDLRRAVEKVRDGDITYAHLRIVDRGVRQVPPDRQAEAVDILTDLAEVAPVADVRVAAQHLAHVLDPDGSLSRNEQQFDSRYLTLAPLMDGMTAVDGLLDSEAAALLTNALEPFLTPADADDRRTAAQRRADGLIQIVQSACDHRLLPVAGGERPHLQVVVPRDAVHPVSLARLACDAQLTALLLDEHGVVVDLGHTKRLFSPQQRKLLAARDGGCRWPGCTRPPAHSDAHHVQSWLDGGPTDVTNAVLLCRFHHRNVHERGWRLQVLDSVRGTNGPVTVCGPEGRTLTSIPRGP